MSPAEWRQEIIWAICNLKKDFSSSLCKLAKAGSVYYIWKATNDCVFGTIYELVVTDVQDRVLSWRNLGKRPVNTRLY